MTSVPWREKDADRSKEPFTEVEQATIALSLNYFWYFLNGIYKHSFEGQQFYSPETKGQVDYKFASVHREWALLTQFSPRMCLQSARGHLKTTVVGQGFPFWYMAKAKDNSFVDGVYFSYNETLAAEKTADLKRFIKANPYTRFWRDRKPSAESIINYLVDWGDGPVAEVYLRPSGIKSATRGRHPKFVIADDILRDFANPLSSTELSLISRIFRNAIMSMPSNPSDPLILIGTPQSYDDIMYQLANDEEWMWLMYPAVKNWDTQETQWPEKYDYDRLMRIRKSHGESSFSVEQQLTPVTITDQFLTREDLIPIVDGTLKMWDLTNEFPNQVGLATYAGLDIGKTVHPSHVIVFLELPDKTLVPLYHAFLDHMEYPRQVRLLNTIANRFKCRGYYDRTNNVLEDRGLSRRWVGKQFNKRLKANMATLLEKRVFAEDDDPGLVLPDDERFLNQIVAVRKDLTAPETADGHGDSFWSTALAVKAAEDGPAITDIGSADNRRVVQQ